MTDASRLRGTVETPDGRAGAPLSRERLLRLKQMQDRHFWFAGRWALVASWLHRCRIPPEARILDLGCGPGRNLARLASLGWRAAGLDLSWDALLMAQEISRQGQVLQADAAALPFQDNSFHAVLALDLLEHVDDAAALSEIFRVVKPGGWLILTVPATPWLYGYRDRAAGHLRRYTRHRLAELVRRAGFEILDLVYYLSFLFPLLALARTLVGNSRLWRDVEDAPPGVLNAIMGAITRMELAGKSWISLPWGSTLALLAGKPSEMGGEPDAQVDADSAL